MSTACAVLLHYQDDQKCWRINSLVEGHAMLCYYVTTASTGSHKYEVFK